jgi:hypothetical protein
VQLVTDIDHIVTDSAPAGFVLLARLPLGAVAIVAAYDGTVVARVLTEMDPKARLGLFAGRCGALRITGTALYSTAKELNRTADGKNAEQD